jgi:hypothetical protein
VSIKKNPYCVPYALQEEMKNQLDAMFAESSHYPLIITVGITSHIGTEEIS